MIRGITDASATRKPVMPCTRSCGSTTASLSTPILQVPTACPKLAEPRRASSRMSSAVAFGPGITSISRTPVKGTLIPEFARDFDGAHDGCKIVVGSKIVAIDYGGILKVVAGQADGAPAGRLHQSRRDGECVRRRRTKTRGRFGCNRRQLFEDQIDIGIARGTTRQVSLCLDGIAVGRPIRHLAFVLEHDAGDEHMVLQILANAGQVLDDVDSKAAKRLRVADA